MKLHHAAVICSSEKKADQFYKEILKLEKIKNYILSRELTKQIFGSPDECQIIFYSKGNSAIEVFIPKTSGEKLNPFVHLCLEVKKREHFLEHCQTLGIIIKRVQKGESFLSFIEDFDGNLWTREMF